MDGKKSSENDKLTVVQLFFIFINIYRINSNSSKCIRSLNISSCS